MCFKIAAQTVKTIQDKNFASLQSQIAYYKKLYQQESDKNKDLQTQVQSLKDTVPSACMYVANDELIKKVVNVPAVMPQYKGLTNNSVGDEVIQDILSAPVVMPKNGAPATNSGGADSYDSRQDW
jgi:hypothetical protein